jgi:hypothetical protein
MMPKAREVRIDGVGDDGSNKEEALRGAWQMWHRNGTHCPKELHSLSSETLNVARAKMACCMRWVRGELGVTGDVGPLYGTTMSVTG